MFRFTMIHVEIITPCAVEITQYALKGQKILGGCVKTPNINKKNSLYVLVWMYNEFLFFYKKRAL